MNRCAFCEGTVARPDAHCGRPAGSGVDATKVRAWLCGSPGVSGERPGRVWNEGRAAPSLQIAPDPLEPSLHRHPPGAAAFERGVEAVAGKCFRLPLTVLKSGIIKIEGGSQQANKGDWGRFMVKPLVKLNAKQQKTFDAIFHEPVRSNVVWEDVDSLIRALGGEEIRKNQKTGGSRVRFKLNGVRGFFHKPHPEKVADKGCIKDLRVFLVNAGVVYEDDQE